jgi:fructose-1,6-bisphosphatase/inositol monophosphatase family enzyme
VGVDAEPELRPARLAALSEAYQEQVARRREMRNRGDVRTLGTIALELALTACGVLQFSAFWMPRIWDVAAGVSLIKEAGGTVLRREERGQPWAELHNFEAPPALGLRKWRGSIIGANPQVAAEVERRVQDGRDPFAPAPRS